MEVAIHIILGELMTRTSYSIGGVTRIEVMEKEEVGSELSREKELPAQAGWHQLMLDISMACPSLVAPINSRRCGWRSLAAIVISRTNCRRL